ncbi:MAG: hypothetical protein GY719_02830 [bacterium]|nr:hypothetical protein [bacterium]
MSKKKKAARQKQSKPTYELTLDSVVLVVANALILGVVLYAWIVRDFSRDFYYLSAQEDEYMEWGTFWAFMLACGLGVYAAWRQRRATGQLPWFLLGVSLFCFVVAMEEISWGQRMFGYRPPVYFLENNFQQELNVHNVISTKLRKLLVKGVILGFGVALPLLTLMKEFRKLFARTAVVAPPLGLAPSFFGAFLLYQIYPWDFSGEWVELMLGLGFLFAAIAAAWQFSSGEESSAFFQRKALVVAVAAVLVVGVGFAHAEISHRMRGGSEEILETASGELEALKRDFRSGKVKTRCNRHKRLYAFKEKYDQDYLLEGAFASLAAQGLPEERAEFFLDPWNSPYWIRDRCDSDAERRVVFVYSFGPNRRRESSRWEILGDDVGSIIYDGKSVKRLPRSR